MPPLFPSLAATFGTLRRVPFVIWIIIGLFFVYAGAEQIAPVGQAQHFKDLIVFYILFQVALLAYWKKRPAWMQATLNQRIAWFVGGCVITVIVIVGIGTVRGLGLETTTYSVTAPVYLIVTHALLVAFSEEIIFRGLLSQIITPIPAAVGFGLFHFWAYGGSWVSMSIAMFAGLLFYVIMRKTNIFTVMGIHGGYNCGVLGIFRWII